MAILDSFINPANGGFRFWRLIALDVVAILFLSLLVVRHPIPVRLAAVAYPVLFAANYLVIRGAQRQYPNSLAKVRRFRKLEWLAVAAFVASALYHIGASVVEPSVRSLVEAAGSTVLAALVAFFVYRARQVG